ncbi:hypothetical protein EJ03DRAFT_89657 [Teratosphaeria nubilosa]|uniref:Uncharacterized protein n=1 Tax=Teratosphaeria nubilosa TaxID=161662 RepID=A0A6G1L9T0_9PEZI|nr:hypothetical protein EJ03DRAFT_89657 [Teratosphaeria nubilosa]
MRRAGCLGLEQVSACVRMGSTLQLFFWPSLRALSLAGPAALVRRRSRTVTSNRTTFSSPKCSQTRSRCPISASRRSSTRTRRFSRHSAVLCRTVRPRSFHLKPHPFSTRLCNLAKQATIVSPHNHHTSYGTTYLRTRATSAAYIARTMIGVAG